MPRRPTTWPRYALAPATVSVAALLEYLLWPYVAPSTSPVFIAAVIVSAMYGGLGPALLATALSAVAAAYFFMPPAKSFDIGWDDAMRLCLFAATAFVVSALVSARRRSEAALAQARDDAQRANAAKDRFLAILSHELRTPLSPILMSAASVADDPGAPSDVREAMSLIRQNAELQARIIDDLLDLTRLEQGKFHLQLELADVHALLRLTARVVRADLQAKRIDFRLDLAAARHRAWGDSARLQQIFWNLARNAIKFTPDGGSITIRTRNAPAAASHNPPSPSDSPAPDTTRLIIEFSDTGIGISPEILPRIFDPFEQGGPAVTGRYGGLGLGLSISKSLVELHGGSLHASSPGPGKGATFSLSLEPASQSECPPDRQAATLTPDASPRPFTILLVEDHQPSAKLVATLLRRKGHTVSIAHTAAEALKSVSRGDFFDVIISDLDLPDGSGADLLRSVRQHRPDTPAIALSGHGMDTDIRASHAAGFRVHLVKPVDLPKLEAALQRVHAQP